MSRINRLFRLTLLTIGTTLSCISIAGSMESIKAQEPEHFLVQTPKADLKKTELDIKKLELEVEKLQIENKKLQTETLNNLRDLSTSRGQLNFFFTNASLIVAIFIGAGGLLRYLNERKEELRNHEDQRFELIVNKLAGAYDERVVVAGLLPTFLRKEYKRFYIQVFNLVASSLRNPHTENQPQLNQDIFPDALTQSLVSVLQQSYPNARKLVLNDESYRVENRGYGEGDETLLMGKYLNGAGLQLNKAYLEGVDLKYAWLRGASLNKAILKGAQLSKVNFEKSVIKDADLNAADLTNATLIGANFDKSDLTDAILIGASFDEAHFKEAKLIGANLSQCKIKKANFKEAKLIRADLTDAKFEDVILEEANFQDAILKNAVFKRVNLTNVKNLTPDQIQSISNESDIDLNSL